MTVSSGLVARLRRQMAAAELVLFTGAGFSRAAVSTSGLPVPGVWDLKKDLWRLAFAGDPEDLASESLADIYGVAMNKNRHALQTLLQSCFTVTGLMARSG